MDKEDMAKTADVSEKTIKQAKRAHEAGLGDAVRDGIFTAERAAKIAKPPEAEHQAAIENPKSKPEPKSDNAYNFESHDVQWIVLMDSMKKMKKV